MKEFGLPTLSTGHRDGGWRCRAGRGDCFPTLRCAQVGAPSVVVGPPAPFVCQRSIPRFVSSATPLKPTAVWRGPSDRALFAGLKSGASTGPRDARLEVSGGSRGLLPSLRNATVGAPSFVVVKGWATRPRNNIIPTSQIRDLEHPARDGYGGWLTT